jgi:hypothetical protein
VRIIVVTSSRFVTISHTYISYVFDLFNLPLFILYLCVCRIISPQ